MTIRYPLLFALPCLLAACSHTAPTAAGKPSAQQNDVLLLGEVHDNATGHAQRAGHLRDRIDAGWRPAIAMEQFDTDQQSALDTAMDECANADCVVAKVAPEKSSWNWDYYTPLIELAIRHDLPLLAANLSRGDASKIVKEGFSAALPPDLVARYRLDQLPVEVLGAQETEVRDGHCGMLPEAMLAPMAKAQIARDVVMAETMRPHAGRGVVLIAGNGHVRDDIGVPYWLRRDGLSPRAEGFIEPDSDASPYDTAHRIPRTQRPDPCAQFKTPSTPASNKGGFHWPNGQKAAVNLAYDDALDSQLDNAIPALDRHDLKASFYLTLAAAPVRARLDEWRTVARNGHELGNHSLFHQCSAKGKDRGWVQPEQDLDTTIVARMRMQVELASTMLQAMDAQSERTFTAPCGDRVASDGNYVDAVRDRFIGIKLGHGVVPDMRTLDLFETPVITPVGMSGKEMISFVEEAGRRGSMVGFTFHGIGGDHLQTSIKAHDALLAYLDENRDSYWVDTFRNQARWIRSQRAAAKGALD